MKQAIMGYITALINSYERDINRLHHIKANAIEVKKYENFKNTLSDLLDFVAYIPGEDTPVTMVFNGEVKSFKKRIRELEETCEANNEVVETQYKKIQELKNGNHRWNILCEQLREKNKTLKGDNNAWQNACNLLRAKLESMEGIK